MRIRENEGNSMDKSERIQEILNLIAQYNRKMYKYGREFRSYGIKQLLRQEQIHLIEFIGKNPGCNLRFLSEQTGASVATVSLQIDRLRQIGLVAKRRSSVSQREVEINLTEEGNRAFLFHEKLDNDYFSRSTQQLNRYSDAELQTIHSFLNELFDSITIC